MIKSLTGILRQKCSILHSYPEKRGACGAVLRGHGMWECEIVAEDLSILPLMLVIHTMHDTGLA